MASRASMGLLAFLLAFPAIVSAQVDVRGNISLDLRHFPEHPQDVRQHGDIASVSVEPEFYWEWNDGIDSLTFSPFGRIDGGDDERSDADVRELLWLRVADSWELRAGIGKVFWGVTEAQHLVDIVNQTDLVENPDGEDKLGQPMIWLSMPKDWGTLDLFVLPGFRERTFPGEEGRLRTAPRVDTDLVQYASDDEDSHIDYAARWSHYLGIFEFGVSWFDGTSRDPVFVPSFNPSGELVLAPRYEQITQSGLDLQAVAGSWLLKLEWINRDSEAFEAYNAASAGLEYTFSSFLGTRADVGVIAEYLYDERDDAGPFQDDIFAGFRIALNDAQSTEILAGVIADQHTDTRLFNLEASRRMGEDWKLALEARFFSSVDEADPLFSQRDDDYISLNISRFF